MAFTIPRWTRIALAHIGESEIAGVANNRWVVDCLKSVGITGPDEIAWCSASLNWCMEAAGKCGTGSALARSWMKWGKAIPTPRFGCVVVLKRGKLAWQGHCGQFIDAYGGKVYVLGGNQGDRFGVSAYNLSDLLGYRWPVAGRKGRI